MSFNEEFKVFKKKLTEISNVIDSLHKTPSYSKYGYNMVRVKDLEEGYINLINTKKVIKKVYKEFTKKYEPQRGDIVLSRVGSYGIVSYVNTDEKFCLGQNTVVINPNTNVDNKYLYYYLISKKIKNQIEQLVVGTTQRTISLKNIRTLLISIPSFNNQKKISSFISKIDEKIENNNQINQTLEEMAQAIYKSWFIDFEPFQEGELIESKLGLIPEDWEVKNISDVVNITYGKNLAKKNMSGSGYKVFSASGLVGYHKDYLYKKPQILMTCRGSGCGDIYESSPKSFVTNNCLVFETNDDTSIDRYYLRLFLLNSNRDQFITGSAQPQITITNISKMKILIPSEKSLNKFKEIVSKFINKINSNKKENQSLKELRDSLLPKLMSGEIRIPSDK